MGRFVAMIVLATMLVACGDDPTISAGSTSTSVSTTVAESSTTTLGTSPTTTRAISTTATTAASPPEPVDGWTRLEADPEVFGAVTITDGATADGRFVLVGCEGFDQPTRGFPIWWADGVAEWQHAAGFNDIGCLTQVESSAFGFFAHGAGNQFRSLDGVTWERLDLIDEFGFENPGQLGVVFAVFVSPEGDRVTLLFSRASEAESRVATLVTTTDGETWQEGPAASAALFDSSSISAVIEGGPGLIAVGSSPGGEFVPSAAVFVSSDGLNWTRTTPRNDDFNDKVMNDVMPFRGGYVAVGGDFFTTGLMTAWTSPDGIEWSRSPHPAEETDPSVAHMTAETLTEADGSILATGRDFDARRSSDQTLPVMWVSTDGITWTRADFDEARGAIPFIVIDRPEHRIGVWPPPFSINRDPVQIFGAD